MTRKALAEKAHMPYTTLADIENGGSNNSTYIARMAHALGVHALWLETNEGQKLLTTAQEPTPTPYTPLDPMESELMIHVRGMDERGLILLIDKAEQIAARHPRQKKEAA